MGKPAGFMEHPRKNPSKRPVEQRLEDYQEIEIPLSLEQLQQQASRCMDCGIPSCHSYGCPLHNRIPDWNDMVYKGKWRRALDLLHESNNFPEITGRICPAPCECACTLAINIDPVTIRHIELQIVERGWENGWLNPQPAIRKTGKRVAVIGSGPSGLAAAQQLARAGHDVVVFEKDDRIGGLLRYGIPDFKLDKKILDRRLDQMKAEGVQFQTDLNVGADISVHYLEKMFHAICITMGATIPRDLSVPGRDYENVVFAMDYLKQQNKINAGDVVDPEKIVSAKNKVVIVIGGGDTGSDCVGTARRQGAAHVHQFEILPEPPADRPADTPWPQWPRILRTSTSHEEGCTRHWSVLTKNIIGHERLAEKLHAVRVDWRQGPDGWKMSEIEGSDFSLDTGLILLAMGFLHVEHGPLVKGLDLKVDSRGNLIVEYSYMTSKKGVSATGDAVRGASLVVHAINTGRLMAQAVDRYLIE